MAGKLGRGDYEGAGPFAHAREEGRDLFLTSVVARYPVVLESLWHTAREVALTTDDFRNVNEGWSAEAREARSQRRSVLKDRLATWGQFWNLDARWIRERAENAVREWVAYPETFSPPPPWDLQQFALLADYLAASPTFTYGVGPVSTTQIDVEQSADGPVLSAHTRTHEARFLFAHPGWHPTLRRRVDYETAIRAEFETKLADYLAAREKLAEAEGWRRTTEKREHDHFDWLARYQVGGEDFRAIAASVQRDRMTVTEAVKGSSDLIDLRLRLPRQGRPPKK